VAARLGAAGFEERQSEEALRCDHVGNRSRPIGPGTRRCAPARCVADHHPLPRSLRRAVNSLSAPDCAAALRARLSVRTAPVGPPSYPQLPVGPPPAPCVRAPADDDPPARRRGECREGLPDAADLRGAEQASSKPRRVRRIARAIPLRRPRIGIARLSEAAQSGERDAVSRVPRGLRQRVRALPSVRGGCSRQSLARKRAGAPTHRL
jgi:hypothetical protein